MTRKLNASIGGFILVLAFLLLSYPSTAKAVEYTPDLIPKMSSNTSPEGVVRADTERPADQPWMAFDDDPWRTSWATASGGTHWLEYEFKIPRTITKYYFCTVETQGDAYYSSINHVALEAYDGHDWVTLHSADVGGQVNEVKNYNFEFNNTIAYKRYRIKATNGPEYPFLIFEVSMYETVGIPAKPVNAKGYSSNKVNLYWDPVSQATQYKIKRSLDNVNFSDYATVTTPEFVDTNVIKGTPYYYKISAVNQKGRGPDSDVVFPVVSVVPVMTGNTSNGAVASASTEHLPWNPAWHAFDNNPDTWWAANDTYVGYLAIELPSPEVVTDFTFVAGEEATELGDVVPPTIFNFEGFNGTTWDVLGQYRPAWDWGLGQFGKFHVNNTTAYKKYRINTTGTAAGYQYGHLAIDDFQLYIEPKANDPISYTFSQGFDYSTPEKVTQLKFNLSQVDASYYLPTSSTVEGYNEESGWENIDYTGAIAFGANELILDNTTAYKKYRINLQFNQSSSVNLSGLTILK